MANQNLIDLSAASLRKSDRGRQAMRDLLQLIENGATGLDAEGQVSLSTLLQNALGGKPQSVRDALREALGAEQAA